LFKDKDMEVKEIGMLSRLSGVIRRTPESRACIDELKSKGKTGREARRECRRVYGSRLGNAGRELGILPQEAKGLTVSSFAQKQFRKRTPNKMGMVNEQLIVGTDGTTPVRKAGFQAWWLLLGLIFFVPAIRKQIGF
jgi:hypothetical protein